ncbi:MAG: SpoIIE family protein phosphatase [Bacteroidia bacterium]|nr:SpoIIE family protein phosphatase [Bacteroidia bacterium]
MLCQRNIKGLVFIISLIVVLCTQAQTYNFRNYNTEHGLPQSQVLSMYQDTKGFVWFGTNSGGVGKYDGNKFIKLTKNDGLIDDVVFSIAENNKGELLFGTSKGLSVYNQFQFKNYSEKEGLKNAWIYKLLSVGPKTWIGTQKGVFVFEAGKITAFEKNDILNASSVYSMFMDKDQNIWFGTLQNGVIRYVPSKGEFKQFNSASGIMSDFIFSIAQDDDGTMLIGTSTGLNTINKDLKIKAVNEIKGNGNISYSSILKLDKGVFYFGTYSEGMFLFDFKTAKPKNSYGLTNGLTYNSIMCLMKDREGNIWIGTNGTGVYKFFNNRFVYYTKNNGLLDNYINAVAEDANGVIWAGCSNNGVAKIENGKVTSYKTDFKGKKYLPDNSIYTILPLKDGSVLFGTGEGICKYKDGVFSTLEDPVIRTQYINSLYEDSKGRIWIGTNNGVFKMENGVVSEEKEVNKLKEDGILFKIFFAIEDKNGNMLFGLENGLVQYDGTKTTLLNGINKSVYTRITCAVLDEKKNIWLGTSDGLYLYNYTSYTQILKKQGYINFLQMNDKSNLYVGSNNGIDVLNVKDFYNNNIQVHHFGKDDGLLSLESNANAGALTKDGRVLVGTVSGLEIYDPSLDVINKKEASLNITDIKLFFGQEDMAQYANAIDSLSTLPRDLILPSSKNNLTFKYVGISLIAPEKVMYQYKLEGLDKDWTPENSKTEVTYPSLPPGTYTFMVRSKNNDGIWNTSPATFTFEILPPWYQTWWFYTLCVIAVGAGIFAYNTIKTKKLVADKAKLEKQVDERTKEVVKQKEEIQNKNNEITDSIKYAKNIQEALLPSLKKTQQALDDCFILYLPKDIVSGDFFWHSDHNSTQFIAAADCTGHGVPGAFMSIVGNNLLNEIINQRNISSPGSILLELHKGVKEALNQSRTDNERRDGMDIALCAIRKKRGTVEYAGANRPLWIYRKDKGEMEIIKPNKFAIGGLEFEEKREYANHTIEVKPGDIIYMFSDGFADQFGGPRGKKFMLSNMQKLLLSNINQPMDVQKTNISNAFKDWKDSLEQIDDVLVIGIRI